MERAFSSVAAHVKPAVVSVYSEKLVRFQAPDQLFPFGDDLFRQFFGQQFSAPRSQPREYNVPERGMGSGMIIDKQGRILTNHLVVGDVDKIKVRLADKREFEATVIGSDSKSDVAIIAIKGRVPNDLTTVELGDSEALQPGNIVIAVGAPFGLTQTVTHGIISATGRQDVGISDYEDFLQTDAAINPGNSGGPLVNMRGQVIGMNTAIATNVGQFGGVGFAIPVSMIKMMLPTLIQGKTVSRGMLGVAIQDINEDLAKQFQLAQTKGALVAQVNKDSPAEKAGIKLRDVIVRYANSEVSDGRQLRNLVSTTAPGTRVAIEVVRNGKRETLTATIAALTTPAASAESQSSGAESLAELGLRVEPLTPERARQYGLEGTKGVIITAVENGSPAAMAHLQAGDLIVEADRRLVTSVAELQNAIVQAKQNGQVLLLIKRRGGSLFVVLRLK